ncbi:MAG: cadherin repeat domain-containing protein, partial [Gammaproteobacteria bacterium]
MADDKGKIYDSINEVDEAGSLDKAKTQESVSTSEAREEHFKQNIMMDVAEHPDGEEVIVHAEDQQIIDEIIESSERTSQEEVEDSSSRAKSIPANHEEANNLQSASDNLTTEYHNSDTEQRENVISQGQAEIESTSHVAEQGVEKFSAFELQSVDQQIEEALIGETETIDNESSVGSVSDIDANSNQVNESASIGDIVGVTAFAEDPDGDSVIYSLTINPDNAFAIDSITGVVTVINPDNLDFETAANILLEVTATSEDGS